MKGQPCNVKVMRTLSQEWCAELDAPYSHLWVYATTPVEALRKLVDHSAMLECYRPRVAAIITKYMAHEIESLTCVDITNF